MRMLMKVVVPAETGNKAIREGLLQKLMQEMQPRMRPEATYFYTENGKRTMHFFFDMKESSQIAELSEPFFMTLDADVQWFPVMNQEDLMKGLSHWNKR